MLTGYWNGAVGDVGPRLTNGCTTGDIRFVEELGGVAAADAMRAYRARGVYTPGKLTVREGEVKIPYKKIPPLDEVQQILATYGNPEKLINIYKLTYAYYKSVEAVYLAGCPAHDDHFRIPQTIIDLGDVAFIPFPFEIFSEISLRIREHAPIRYALSLSNANGYHSYLPSEDQIVRGGYEIESFLYSGAYTLVNNTDQYLVEENLKILEN